MRRSERNGLCGAIGRTHKSLLKRRRIADCIEDAAALGREAPPARTAHVFDPAPEAADAGIRQAADVSGMARSSPLDARS